MTTLSDLRKQYPQYEKLSDGDFLYGIKRKFYPNMHPRAFFDSVDGGRNAHATIKRFRDEYRADATQPMEGEGADQRALRLGGSLEAPVGDAGGQLWAAARSALQGLTFGAGDEIVAAGVAALSPEISYDAALQAERDRLEIGRDQNPKTAFAAELSGAVAVPGAALNVTKGAPIANATKSAGLAGAGGAVYGFNAGEGGFGNRVESGAQTGLIAGALGATAPMLGGVVEDAINSRAAQRQMRKLARAAPKLDDLRSQASSIFQRADTTGLPADGLPDAVQGIASQIGARPVNPKITPRASGVMQELTDAATEPRATVPFGELQDIRRLAGAARGDFTNPTEQRAGAIIQEGLDAFVDSADPKLSADITKAREMWGTLRKSEQIQEVIDKAELQASGFENGLRIGLRQILNSKKKSAGFTKAERSAMRDIVEGTPFGNTMKKVGRLGFGMGQQTNVLSGVASSGVAGAAGATALGPFGVLLGAVPPVLGAGAKRLSEKNTKNMVDGLMGMIATRSAGAPQVTSAQRGLLDEAARRAARVTDPLGLPDLLLPQQTTTAQ